MIEVSPFALLSGIGKISDVAFMKKFIQCRDWIKWLTENIRPNPIMYYKKPDWLEPYQVLAVDLFSLTCSQFKITEQSIGESLKNVTFGKGCLVIADRAYGTIKSIEHCLNTEADFIIRIKNKAFNLYDESGQKITFTNWLGTVGEKTAECKVYIK